MTREASVRIEDFDGRHLRWEWRLQAHESRTEGEVATLRATVQEFPDHPARDILRRVDELAAGRGSNYQLWRRGDDWRLSTTFTNQPEGAVPWFDRALAGRRGWSMTPSQLRLLSRDALPSDGQLQRQLPGHLADLLLAISGGMGELQGGATRDVRITRQGEEWRAIGAVTRGDWEGRFDLRATWKADINTWATARLEAAWTRPGDAWTNVLEANEPRWSPVLQRLTYGRVVESLSGVHAREVQFRDVQVETIPFETLVADPTDAGTDPIRGPSQYSSIDDQRTSPDSVRLASMNAGGSGAAVPPQRSLIWIGWGVIGILVIVLIVSVIKRVGR